MVLISVLYPKSKNSYFDHDYYMAKHMPMVRARWSSMGLGRDTLLRGSSTLQGGPADFELIGILPFESVEHMQTALAAHGAQIIGDIPNFTNVSPLIQINESAS